jgi:hypothetical protein
MDCSLACTREAAADVDCESTYPGLSAVGTRPLADDGKSLGRLYVTGCLAMVGAGSSSSGDFG